MACSIRGTKHPPGPHESKRRQADGGGFYVVRLPVRRLESGLLMAATRAFKLMLAQSERPGGGPPWAMAGRSEIEDLP